MHVFAVKLLVGIDLDEAVVLDPARRFQPRQTEFAGLQIDDDRRALGVAEKQTGQADLRTAIGFRGDERVKLPAATAKNQRGRRRATADQRRPHHADGLIELLEITHEPLGLAVGGVGEDFEIGNLRMAPRLGRRQLTGIGHRKGRERNRGVFGDVFRRRADDREQQPGNQHPKAKRGGEIHEATKFKGRTNQIAEHDSACGASGSDKVRKRSCQGISGVRRTSPAARRRLTRPFWLGCRAQIIPSTAPPLVPRATEPMSINRSSRPHGTWPDYLRSLNSSSAVAKRRPISSVPFAVKCVCDGGSVSAPSVST